MKTIKKRWVGIISPSYKQYRNFLRDLEEKGLDTSNYVYVTDSRDVDGRGFNGYILLSGWYHVKDSEELIELIKSRYDKSKSLETIEIPVKYLDREGIREFRQDWDRVNSIGKL